MFHYDRGLKLTSIDLAVDFRRRQPRGFISHAHTDHMAKHELAFCTPATAALYQFRFGIRPVRLMEFGAALKWNSLELTAIPAGHVLGSAMLLANDGSERLLYTGDFKLGPSATSEEAFPPKADVLVMESTFGDPKYRLPPRQEVVASLLRIVTDVLDRGGTPVIQAYVLGKAQEVTKILTSAGIRVLQHPLVHRISQIYEKHHCSLGDYAEYCDHDGPGQCAVVVPPMTQKAARLRGIANPTTIAVTGWAMDAGARFRLRVDYAVPLSDHADYDDLLACIDLVAPHIIYCTHGPESFVTRLQKLGHNAHPLSGGRQLWLKFA
jgi:putative mRNA 3-end processing factor